MASRTVWALCAVAALATGGALLLRRPSDGAPAAPAQVPVMVDRAEAGDVPIELEAIGRVAAFSSITVRSQVSGVVQAIDFADGQYVERGDLLGQIDPRPLQQGVDQDRAALRRDQASLANAEADLRRYVPLVKKGIISVQQADTQRSLVAQLQATCASDAAALNRGQVQLGYATVRAPISGILGLHLVDAGNLVNPTDPGGIVALTQIQPIAALFALPQANLEDIQVRQAATPGGLAVQAYTQDGTRLLDTGRLLAVSNAVDPASGAVTLKGVFPNARRTLWPGASVTMRLLLETQHGGVTVPDAAIDEGPSGAIVWTVSPDGHAHATQVSVRQQAAGRTLVASGLQPGQDVVTDGQYGLTENAQVLVRRQSRKPQDQAVDARDGTPLHTNQPGRLGINP